MEARAEHQSGGAPFEDRLHGREIHEDPVASGRGRAPGEAELPVGGDSLDRPAFYGLVEGSGRAEEVSERLSEFLNSDGRRGETFYTSINNTGATITVTNI